MKALLGYLILAGLTTATAQVKQGFSVEEWIGSRPLEMDAKVLRGSAPGAGTAQMIPDGMTGHPVSTCRLTPARSLLYVIDTVVIRERTRTTRRLNSFNGSGKRTVSVTQRLEGTTWWQNLDHHTNSYAANGNMLTDLCQHSDGTGCQNDRLLTYTYDTHNNILLYRWDDWWNGQWTNHFAEEYTYDANDNLLTCRHMNGPLTGGDVSITTYTYDAAGDMIGLSTKRLVNYGLEAVTRSTLTYDAENRRLSELREVWSGEDWIGEWHFTFAYSASRDSARTLCQVWNNGWVNYWCSTEVFDAAGNVTSSLHEFWNGHWENSWLRTYTYDSENNKLSYLSQAWSTTQWENRHLWTFTYDKAGNLTEYWVRQWTTEGDGGWSPLESSMDIGHRVTDGAGNSDEYWGSNVTFHYLAVGAVVADEDDPVPTSYSLSQNYPNPFNPSTSIKYGLPTASTVRLIIYDMLGREASVLVDERKDAGVHEVTFDGGSLSSGVYLYRLQVGEFTQTKRLLLLK